MPGFIILLYENVPKSIVEICKQNCIQILDTCNNLYNGRMQKRTQENAKKLNEFMFQCT